MSLTNSGTSTKGGHPEYHPAEAGQQQLSRRTLSQQRQQAEENLEILEAESLSEALPEGFRSDERSPHFQALRLQKPLVPSVFISTLLNISCGSIWGVLARKGLIALTSYPGLFLGGLIWANFVACYVMGMAIESEALWAVLLDEDGGLPHKFPSKGAIPLFAAITTGFCGSCSSFSSMILEMFNLAANLPPVEAEYPNAAYGILGAIEVLLTHLGLSLAGFYTGKHVVRYLERSNYSMSTRVYFLLELVSSVFGAVAYIVTIVLIAVKSASGWRMWTFSILFAPWGSIVRYLLSRKLNTLKKDFPMGTFTANISGTILLAIFNLLIRGKRWRVLSIPIVNSINACDVLVGLDDGFCGCLTTVSTFMVEICALPIGASYLYGSASVSIGFIGMVLILGAYNWTVGFTTPVC